MIGKNLVKWDGKAGKFQYSQEQIEYWEMKKDEDGHIFYMTQESPRQQTIWCGCKSLESHLRRLYRMNDKDVKIIK